MFIFCLILRVLLFKRTLYLPLSDHIVKFEQCYWHNLDFLTINIYYLLINYKNCSFIFTDSTYTNCLYYIRVTGDMTYRKKIVEITPINN